MGCSTREKSVRNKRRLRSNNPSVIIRNEENLTDCRRNNGIAAETASKPMRILDGASVEEKTKDKEVSSEENEEADWRYCTEEQLEDLLLNRIEFVYNDAVCKIASEGYSGEDALKAVLRNGHYYGSGDLLFNIVKNATSYLENNTRNCSDEADIVFRDLKQLEEYALTGMVCMLRQLRPQLSKGDAMWCLLMSDLHVGSASTLEIPTLPPTDERTKSNGIGPPPLTVISMPSPTRPSCSSSNFIPIGAISEPCKMCAKRTSGFNIAEADTTAGDNISLPQNGFTFDAGTSKLPSTSIAQLTPNACGQSSTKLPLLRRNPAALLPARLLRDWKSKSDLCSQSDGSNNEGLVSTCRPGKLQTQSTNSSEKNQLSTQDINGDAENAADSTSVVAAATELSLGLASPVDAGQDQYKEKPRSCPDIVGAILGSLEQMGIAEKSDGVDQRNEMMLKLVHQIRDLKMQLKERTEWAQQRALQAARKLSKDLAELKTLRMDRDEMLRLRKDKQTVEESAIKRLSEMENDLRKVSGKVDQANAAARRLETENAEVRAEMEASKLSAAESVATCQEVEKREKKGLRRAQTWEKQKSRLQDEINEVKQRTAQVQQQLSLFRDMQQETEAKLKEEERAKEIAIAQAEEERGAKDAAEASSKRREEVLHRKIEMDFQRHKDDIERLEQELARLKATAESCQLNTVSHAPHAADEESVKSLKETNAHLHCKLQELQESSRREGNRDRECIMCMDEEVSVVFLPCAHQVLCVKCNGSHEQKGLKDCPSCRIPIQQRIHVYGVSS
ncbi:MND1-interacting protein 1 [Cryptomeria japonica]|uniref:MND1-interacting protein 1 n=1 Tax=Cryptomeria japonica TaxID=3369 RepID=UPI0025AD8D8D|nr:MND1-interacting protein 1 [Cryptomeria japonica]XP_057818842.1 MND1-interacting protein 1 [Cryptomeria japonica]